MKQFSTFFELCSNLPNNFWPFLAPSPQIQQKRMLTFIKSFFQAIVTDILSKLMADLGPIPGNYIPSVVTSPFRTFLLPKLKFYLKNKSLADRPSATDYGYDCLSSPKCKSFFVAGSIFIDKINDLFPRRISGGLFLEERPDFYLGRFFSMFSENLFNLYFDLSRDGKKFDNQVCGKMQKCYLTKKFELSFIW